MTDSEHGKAHKKTDPVILPSSRAEDPTVTGTGGNKYRVIRLLGRGTMASVYLAEQISMARPVALKILSQALASDPEFVERFTREARASARLNHPNIVAAIDFGEFQHRFFLAMEFIDGESLAILLRHDSALDERRVAGIGMQVIAALRHANEHGVIHLDVKPANIMIRKDGRVKLADFGLAVILEHPGSAEASRKAVGTPYYMAPEQVEGGRLDWRTDQFSLGASLYEAVTGKKPFTGKSVPDILVKRFFEKPEPAWRAGRRVGKGFSAVLAKMLSRSPDGRYQSFGDLEMDFARVLEGAKPVVAKIDSSVSAAPAGSGWSFLGYGTAADRVNSMLRPMRWNWVLYSLLLFLAVLAAYAGAYAGRLAGPRPPEDAKPELIAEAEELPPDHFSPAREAWAVAFRRMAVVETDPSGENIKKAIEAFSPLTGGEELAGTAYAAAARRRVVRLEGMLQKLGGE